MLTNWAAEGEMSFEEWKQWREMGRIVPKFVMESSGLARKVIDWCFGIKR